MIIVIYIIAITLLTAKPIWNIERIWEISEIGRIKFSAIIFSDIFSIIDEHPFLHNTF